MNQVQITLVNKPLWLRWNESFKFVLKNDVSLYRFVDVKSIASIAHEKSIEQQRRKKNDEL